MHSRNILQSYLAQYWFDGKLDKFGVNKYAASTQIY